MFAITTKAKIAAGIAAGALTLGAAGAYAAANANNTITLTTTPTPITLGSGSNTLKVVSLNGQTVTAPTFTSAGNCVSWLAQNKNLALASSVNGSKLPKNYHGQLMRGANAWCKTQLTASTTKSDATETETPDASQSSAPSTDSTDTAAPQSGTHGHGHGHGHGRDANDLD